MKKIIIISLAVISFNIFSDVSSNLESLHRNDMKGKDTITDSKINREVGMWEGKEIHFEPTETTTKTLYTNGLAGCIAVALVVKCQDQSFHAHMSHFPPMNTDPMRQIITAQKANQDFDSLCNNAVEFKKLLIMFPNNWVKNDDNKWKKTISEDDKEHSNHLEQATGVSPTILPYSLDTFNNLGKDDFEVSINNQEQFYQSKSDNHIPHKI